MAEIYYNLGIRLCASIDKLTEKVGELVDIEKERNEIEKEKNKTLTLIKQGISDLTAIQTKYAFGTYIRNVDSEDRVGVGRSYDGKICYRYYNERDHIFVNPDGTEEVLPVNAKLYPEGETRLPRNIHLSDPC